MQRGADQPLAELPVRIRRVLPRQRGAQDRARHAGVPERPHHLRDVDAFGKRELLVRVADAVAPRQEEVLDQQVAIGVVHALLGDDDLRPLGQPLVPVGADGAAGGLVASGVDSDSSSRRVVDPGEIDGLPGSAPDPIGQDGALDDAAGAEREHLPELADGRLQAKLDDLCGAPRRVDVEPDEADERARLGRPRGERLLPVAGTRCVGVGRRQDRLVAVGEPRLPEAGEARAVALAALGADEDRQPPPADPLGDHLAPVGDVERDRPGPARVDRLAEREVVDARLGQRPLAGRAREEERGQKLPRGVVAGPVGRREERVPPDVVVRPQRTIDSARVLGRSPPRFATGGLRRRRVGLPDRERRAEHRSGQHEARRASPMSSRPHTPIDTGAGSPALLRATDPAGRTGSRPSEPARASPAEV